jgi:hypothetical protein
MPSKEINGVIYNTMNSRLIHESSKIISVDNSEKVSMVKEKLFITKDGSYFLYGSGGAGSRYAIRSVSGVNTISSGEDIIPLTAVEARKWAQDHLCIVEFLRGSVDPEVGDK